MSALIDIPHAVSVIEQEERRSPKLNSFVSYIHSFRAVAMFFVVAGHCVALFEWGPREAHLVRSLMQNGTVLFVFVAGFLFQHLSSRFDYRKYLKSKLQNVLLPYLVVSLPILVVKAQSGHGIFNPGHTDHLPTVIQNVAWSLLTGGHIFVTFWFIPMITVFHLLAPAWRWIDRDGRLYYLLPLLVLETIFVHRPVDIDHIGHSFAYFAPVYLYGMWFSRHRERLIAWHDRWGLGLLLALALLVWGEVGYFGRAGHIGSVAPFSTEEGVVGTNALQKLLMCGLLIAALRRLSESLNRKLSYLADASFGVYFLHMYFITGYLFFFHPYVSAGTGIWRYWLSVALVIALSAACLWLARRLFGRQSRYIVGF